MKYPLIALLMVYVSSDVFAQNDGSRWPSAERCYQSYVEIAEGNYPTAEDDPNDLKAHCRRAFEQQLCNFRCSVTKIEWEFAVNGPASTHADRLKAFFRNSAR
jgi:hypothetical protein